MSIAANGVTNSSNMGMPVLASVLDSMRHGERGPYPECIADTAERKLEPPNEAGYASQRRAWFFVRRYAKKRIGENTGL